MRDRGNMTERRIMQHHARRLVVLNTDIALTAPTPPRRISIRERLHRTPAARLTLLLWLLGEMVLAPNTIAFYYAEHLGRAKPVLSAGPLGWLDVLGLVVLSPLLETAIFQWAVIAVCRAIPMINRYPGIWCAVSALFFGLAHPYGTWNMLGVMPGGFAFAYMFLVAGPPDRRAVGVVAGVHGLHNAALVAIRSVTGA